VPLVNQFYALSVSGCAILINFMPCARSILQPGIAIFLYNLQISCQKSSASLAKNRNLFPWANPACVNTSAPIYKEPIRVRIAFLLSDVKRATKKLILPNKAAVSLEKCSNRLCM
jgi:hypothetical protein